MTIREFAEQYRLRAKRDACGERIAPGKLGQIYEHGDGRFGLLLEDAASGLSRARALLGRRRQALAAGFAPHQLGDAESILLFDPADTAQASLAMRLVGAKPKRVPSLAQLDQLARASEIALKPRAGALPAARNDDFALETAT